MVEVDFWCKNCKLDQRLWAYVKNSYGEERFIAECKKCGKELYRYITFKKDDPYYFTSKNAIINRQRFARDLIQPGQTGFQTYYKKEYDKIQKAEEEFSKKQEQKKKERDDFYRRHRYNINEKELAKKVIEAEEKLDYGAH